VWCCGVVVFLLRFESSSSRVITSSLREWKRPREAQLKSGDIAIHAVSANEASTLKEKSHLWVTGAGTRAWVLKATYGVLVHGSKVFPRSERRLHTFL
jgi:hypothetical protein